jgi:hypothetical protein
MTLLIKSTSLRLALTAVAVIAIGVGVSLLVAGIQVGILVSIAGGFIGALPLADWFRSPPPERSVRPVMRVVLALAVVSAVAAIGLSAWRPAMAIPPLALAMLFGSVSGFYFGIRVGVHDSESTKPVEPTGTSTAHD